MVEILGYCQITFPHKTLHRRDEYLAVIRGRHPGHFLQKISRWNSENKDVRLRDYIVHVVGYSETVGIQFYRCEVLGMMVILLYMLYGVSVAHIPVEPPSVLAQQLDQGRGPAAASYHPKYGVFLHPVVDMSVLHARIDLCYSVLQIYAEAECNANEFIHFALPRRNSICGAAEYSEKPRGEQIYLLYRGTGVYMDTRANIPPTNIFALLKCLNAAKDLLIVRHLACATSH